MLKKVLQDIQTSQVVSIRFIKGFSLVELLVVIGITSALMSVVLWDYASFNEKLSVSSAGQEIAIAIRQTQVYGINVREESVNSNEFSSAYGIYFNKTLSPNDYYIFVDKNGDKKYNDAIGVCGGVECVEKIALPSGVTVDSFEGCAPLELAESLQITFIRPKPDADINFVRDNGVIPPPCRSVLSGQVVLKSPRGTVYHTISIEKTGQVLSE